MTDMNEPEAVLLELADLLDRTEPPFDPVREHARLRYRFVLRMDELKDDMQRAQKTLEELEGNKAGAAEHYRRIANVENARANMVAYIDSAVALLSVTTPVTIERQIRIVRGHRRG